MTTLALQRPAGIDTAHVGRLAAFGGLLVLAAVGAAATLAMAPTHLIPGDAHDYWGAWAGGLYQPGGLVWATDYLYSPAFAQLFWPLTLLPWPVFAGLWTAAAATVYVWLLAPLRRALRLAAFAFVVTSVLPGGNIEWLLALVVVGTVRVPAGWAIPLLTKVTPGVGIAWYAGRRDWRALAIAFAVTAAIAFVSLAVAPALWSEWIGALALNAQHGATAVGFFGLIPIPPLALRVPLAACLALWGGRTGRLWTVAAAMVLAQPDLSLNTLGLLAAVPRLNHG